MSLSKDSKLRILENFFGLDYVFFGKPVQKVDYCCPELVSEYITVKGALLSVLMEMFQLVDHRPQSLYESAPNSEMLREVAKESALLARAESKRILSSMAGRKAIKEDLRRHITEGTSASRIEDLVSERIQKSAFTIAVDEMLVKRNLSESNKASALKEWEGKIVKDAYQVLRTNLVEAAMLILDNDTI